eukprot:751305-Hanusia_phi.AAC.3
MNLREDVIFSSIAKVKGCLARDPSNHRSLRRISFFFRTISLYNLSRYSDTENLVLSSRAMRMGGVG